MDKNIYVIANDSEAISKPCDCYVTLRSTSPQQAERNDKYTINFLQVLIPLHFPWKGGFLHLFKGLGDLNNDIG